MTVTVGDHETGNGKGPATDPDDASGAPQVARARDGILADLNDALPDTESIRRWGASLRDSLRPLVTGEIKRIQPPCIEELQERVRNGLWATSPEKSLRVLARFGLWFSVGWSTFWYSIAVSGQRFWRFVTAVALTALIIYML